MKTTMINNIQNVGKSCIYRDAIGALLARKLYK